MPRPEANAGTSLSPQEFRFESVSALIKLEDTNRSILESRNRSVQDPAESLGNHSKTGKQTICPKLNLQSVARGGQLQTTAEA